MLLDEYCGAPFWNSSLTWQTTTPLLTDCFRLTVLIWIPCLFLWLWSSYHVYLAKSSRSKHIPFTTLNVSKFLLCGSLIVFEVVYLIVKLVGSSDVLNDRLVIHSLVIKSVTFALSLYLDTLSKKHGLRSSGVQFLFWLFLFICQVLSLQFGVYGSGWSEHYIVELSFTALISIQLVLNCWADAKPRYTDGGSQSSEKSSPEQSSSFLSRLFFFWFEGLARKGHRRPLELHDLWELATENSSKSVNPPFITYWDEKNKSAGGENHVPPPELHASFKRKNSLVDIEYKPELSNGPSSIPDNHAKESAKVPGSIIGILSHQFGPTFLFGCFLKLVQDLLSFVAPFILKLLIRHTKSDEQQWKGYFYAILLLVVTILSSLIGNQYMYKMYLIGLRIRTAVVGCIYRKSLKISSSSRETTVGEIVNLMSVDAQKLTDMAPYLTIVWSAPLQITLSLYFLYDLLGASVFAGLGVMILLIPVSAFMGIKVKSYQARQMKSKDKRIKLMNEILGGIKVLKLYAWEPSFEEQVTRIRDQEIKVLKESAFVSAIAMFVWTCAPVLVAIVTFTTFILSSEEDMDAEIAFVSLSYFNIMRIPLNLLPMMLVSIMQSTVSIARINKYLNMEEVDEDAVQHDDSEEDPISIRHASFSWRKDTTLHRINLQVGGGQLIAVVGPVGSGKSSLLSAILGEIEKTEGEVNTKGTIAYVSQQAWIQNATVRENILFGRPLEVEKYNQVIEACALTPDLEILPGGDSTEIGEKGINLSGGQKQRVALARAVYNNASIYLLDDPLSAVDAHVGKIIFEKILGPSGLLSRKTRVLVTHGVSYLKQMDRIVVMNGGEITEEGSYKELLERKGAFADFLLQHITSESEVDPSIISDLEVALGKGKEELLRSISVPETGNSDGDQPTVENGNIVLNGPRKVSIDSKAPQKEEQEPTTNPRLIDEESVEQGIVKWNVFLYYLRAIGWKLVLISVFLQLVFQAFAVGSNVWLAIWSDSNATLNGTHYLREEYLCGYASFGVGQAFAIFIATLAMSIGTLSASGLLHSKILNRVLRAPMEFFDTTPLGRIVNRLGRDIEVLDSAVSMSLTSWLKCLFNVAATMIIITYTTPGFILVVIPTVILYTVAQRFYISSSRQLRRLESVTRSPIYSHFTETLTGTSTIRAFRVEEEFVRKSEMIVDQNQMCYFPSIVSARFLAVFLESVGNLVIFFAALFTVTYTSSLTPGQVGLSLSYALSITHALNWLVETTNNVENNLVAVERLKEYNEIKQEAEWDGGEELPKEWPQGGEIIFNSYETKYRDELDTVLGGLSFHIEPKEKIGICGRTGAGKSSIALALFRILEPTSGSIQVDGHDISKLGLHQLRRNLTVIPQDPVIFSGSIRSNLDPFSLYSDDELWHSLRLAHLRGFVKEKEGGLDYGVVEGGGNLSVGQRQLICLARALLRKSKILLLDEATAAIDLETDDLIQETIRNEFGDCTILTIAHRLNTIMDYTRILVLDNGKLVEFDTPANLLRDKESLFYSLARDAGLT